MVLIRYTRIYLTAKDYFILYYVINRSDNIRILKRKENMEEMRPRLQLDDYRHRVASHSRYIFLSCVYVRIVIIA